MYGGKKYILFFFLPTPPPLIIVIEKHTIKDIWLQTTLGKLELESRMMGNHFA
jgi:hypothetical protein